MDKPSNEIKDEEMMKSCVEQIIQSGLQIPTVLINISMTQLAGMQRKMVQSVNRQRKKEEKENIEALLVTGSRSRKRKKLKLEASTYKGA
jgi:hypothetical protein